MDKITLELDKLDALTVLGALEDSALSWRLQAATSTGQEREYAQLRARTLSEQSRRIIDALYPEPVLRRHEGSDHPGTYRPYGYDTCWCSTSDSPGAPHRKGSVGCIDEPAWTPEELVQIAFQSGIEVQRA